MIVWTAQHKSVWDTLMKNGEYIADEEFIRSMVSQKRFESYQILRDIIHFTTPIIWGMNKRLGVDLSELELNQKKLHEIGYKGVGCQNDDVFFILDVPENEVIKTAYYEWTDFLYYQEEEYNSKTIEICLKSMFEVNHNVDDIQILMPKIKKEWIINIVKNIKIKQNKRFYSKIK